MNELNVRNSEYVDKVVIPGTTVEEPLYKLTSWQNAMNNRTIATYWCREIGRDHPKFCILACAMCMYESFSLLERIPRSQIVEYDEILNGLWIHYFGTSVPTIKVVNI